MKIYTMRTFDRLVKIQKSDDTVKRFKCKARKYEGMRRACWYAAMTEDAAQRSRWTFYEVVTSWFFLNQCSMKKKKIKAESGIALVLVLWVLTLLSVMVLEFCYTMRVEATVASNFREGARSYYLAQAGINRALIELVKAESAVKKFKGSKDSMVKDKNKDETAEEEEEESKEWKPREEPYTFPFEGGECEVKIGDEGSKINLNWVAKEAKKNRKLLTDILEKSCGLEGEERDVITDSIIDWVDKDRNHLFNGAEDEYYESLEDPYECRDANFVVTEELLLVRGVTEEIYYGGRSSDEEGGGGEVEGENLCNVGLGRVVGGELLVKKNADGDCPRFLKLEKCFGWISYTLMRSERKSPGDSWRLFFFDQTHILTVVISGLWKRGWQVGLRFRLVSGNPTTAYRGGIFNADSNSYIPVFGEQNGDRLPLFHQLDLRVDKKWVFKKWILSIYLDIQNVYNYQATEFVLWNFNYTKSTTLNGLPIIPSIGLKGAF